MKRACQRIQELLAEHGPAALQQDDSAQSHLEECADCFAVLEGLAELDAALDQLPALNASDELVESLLARPELLEAGRLEASPHSPWRAGKDFLRRFVRRPVQVDHRWRWGTLGVMATVVIAVGLSALLSNRMPMAPPQDLVAEASIPMTEEESRGVEDLRALGYVGGRAELEDRAEGGEKRSSSAAPSPSRPSPPPPPPPPPPPAPARQSPASQSPLPQTKAKRVAKDDGGFKEGAELKKTAEFMDEMTIVAEMAEISTSASTASTFMPANDNDNDNELLGGLLPRNSKLGRPNSGKNIAFRGGSPRIEKRDNSPFALDTDASEEALGAETDDSAPDDSALADSASANTPASKTTASKTTASKTTASASLARQFMEKRGQLDDLEFQPATGYWANTYVPGDPGLRFLQSRLLDRDRSRLQTFADGDLRLHDISRQTSQPFDPPSNAALAVFLHADKAEIQGKTRMLIQVGLQATQRHGGRRGAMNISLILDATEEVSDQTAITLRALLQAFAAARQPGDQFRLLVAGRPGGALVGPEDFRHGALTLAIEDLLAAGPASEPSDPPRLHLEEAMDQAISEVLQADDPSLPLGSSAVVLLTSRSMDSDLVGNLRLKVHRSAVSGVPISVVGIGGDVDLEDLDLLALDGQGNRRLIHAPREATDLVDRELSAVSRAVARAARLRIHLAPGVQLIDILGSRRLNLDLTAQVREAERSIDRRLSRNLGIEADRGDDEAGIQIIIPTFHAGDSHVVLLDVVVPGPGEIADVQVRYKDLVHLENGVTRAQLSVGRGDSPTGPLERNVLKNLLAQRLSELLAQVSKNLGQDREEGDALALSQLGEFRQLLLGLADRIPGLSQDSDLRVDIAMLDEYIRLLDSAAIDHRDDREHLFDSLRFAGQLKVTSRPAPIGGQPRR